MKKYVLEILIVICLFLSGCREISESDVTIKNISNSTLEEVEIRVSGQTFVIKNLDPNEEQKIYYAVKSDSSYLVVVRYCEDRQVEKREGYVTHGFVFHDVIAIDSNDITILSNIE